VFWNLRLQILPAAEIRMIDHLPEMPRLEQGAGDFLSFLVNPVYLPGGKDTAEDTEPDCLPGTACLRPGYPMPI